MRRPEKYVPIGVSFWRDDRIVEVKRPAAILFQQCLGAVREQGAQGTISYAQADQLPEFTRARWRALTTPTVVAPDKGPLIAEVPGSPGVFRIPSWSKWNPAAKTGEDD